MVQQDHAEAVEHGGRNAAAEVLHDVAGLARDHHGTHKHAVGVIREIGDQIPDSDELKQEQADKARAGRFARKRGEHGKAAGKRQAAQQFGGKTVMNQRQGAAESQQQLEIEHGQKQGQRRGKQEGKKRFFIETGVYAHRESLLNS